MNHLARAQASAVEELEFSSLDDEYDDMPGLDVSDDEYDDMPGLDVDVHPPEGPVAAVADAPGALHMHHGVMLPDALPDGGTEPRP